MKKAAEDVCVSYPILTHVTSVVHPPHTVCETVRSLYPNVDRLISKGKKVIVKSPSKIVLFENKNSNLPLPPAPTVTRKRAWLSAVLNYADNFDSVKSVVYELDKDDTLSLIHI